MRIEDHTKGGARRRPRRFKFKIPTSSDLYAFARHQKVPRHDHPRRRVISDIEFVKDKAKDTPKIVAVADASAPPSAAALRGLLLGPLRFRRRPPGRPPCLPKTLLTLTQPRVASLSATVCVA